MASAPTCDYQISCVHTDTVTGKKTSMLTAPRIMWVPKDAPQIVHGGSRLKVQQSPSGTPFVRVYGVPMPVSVN